MAETTQVAAEAAKAPSGADMERAEEFTREPFLLDGEKPADLTPGSPRRRALDAALAEIAAGREMPSIEWRGDYSLLVGLERLLDEEPPVLADGAELNPHQVDALSGTLAALISELEANGDAQPRNGNGAGAAGSNGGARAADEDEEDAELGEEEDEDEDDELAPDEEPRDWDEAEEEDELASEEVLSDPGASRRFWFEHATGAGKTVAAVGFVEASRTGGILILTHRRNLVDQFIGEISDRGYKDRLSPPLLDGADNPYGPV
ncbi:MAG: DEAD/DEAH box helicase family protein, partial [Solirubrobacterales bacterium]